ncbi:Nucleoporin Nup54 alpha-helical domain-containing protein [Plasmodiophora brassicae]|uniref:Uncharacterized protein n=1 Tax=Plasmodiophora brassicae TaxID=37360 RepID=A0A0G4IZ54_PLABS|nr:hypothetical protein PBRA_001616 [Plasmodiophora brassicae]
MTSLFGGFGTTAAPSSGALTVPVTDEIVQLSTPFSKLPANRQADLERIDAEFQKQSLVSAEIDRLLEEAERNEAFSMADISRLEQRLKLLQLQIKRTRNSLLGFREEMRRELKHGEQALFANARLKHKSIQQLWPQLPSRYFFDKMEEFRGRITKLMQDVEDIQHHLSANPSQQSPPQMLHALLSNTHNEVVALSCEVARVHSIVNQQKETFIDEKISKKADPFEVAPKRDESVVQQQQLLLLTAPPAAQPGAAPASTYPALGAPPGQQQSTGFGATTGSGLFGVQPQSTPGMFGTQPTSLFGGSQQQQPPQQQQQSSSLFGSSTPGTASTLFGSNSAPAFGQTGQSATQPTSLFGQSTQQPGSASGFGASSTPQTNLFGSSATAAPQSSLFGGAAPASTGTMSLFGTSTQAPATTSTTPFQFGATR